MRISDWSSDVCSSDLMLSIAPLGAFVKNIALVATFMPLALRVCQRTHTSPGRVLMPMAYAAQMGGVCTLIGTSSNLLADTLAPKHGMEALGGFEFTRMGVIRAVCRQEERRGGKGGVG